MGGDLVDLTNTSEFTFALLDDTWAWRQRLVEEFEIGSVWHTVVKSKYQIELPPDLLGAHLGSATPGAVRALLPITTRPKRPLLGFGMSGPDGSPVHLLLRVSIAAIEAEYLARLRDKHDDATVTAGLPDALLEAICVFTPSVYATFDPKGKAGPGAVADYLSAGLGFEISPEQARELIAREQGAERVLSGALQEPADPFSSSERVLLAAPRRGMT